MTYNIWNKWDTLETVMLGSFYPAEFFQDVKSDRIRSALTRIADEEAEEYEPKNKIITKVVDDNTSEQTTEGDKVLKRKLGTIFIRGDAITNLSVQ